MADWSDLPHEMLVTIAEQLTSPKDFVVFGAVCKSWHAAADKEYLKRLYLRQGIPYLMLPVRDDNGGEARELYSLIEDKIVDSVKVPNFKRRKCLESLGWLLASEEDGSVSLVNPFSGVEIQLPYQKTFPNYEYEQMDEYVFVYKMVLSARPNEASDFVLMVICGGCSHLAFWMVGDTAWNKIDAREGAFSDVVYHDGQFYAIGFPGYVWVFNIDRDNKRAEHKIITGFRDTPPPGNLNPYRNDLVDCKNLYILKTCDSLFVITRTLYSTFYLETDDPLYNTVEMDKYNTTRFQVYEIDVTGEFDRMRNAWKEINSLGTMAVFLGHNATTAVDVSMFSGIIKPNHIYFTDDNYDLYYFEVEEGGGKDMGVYSFGTGKVEPFYHGELLLSKVSTSTWITPCVS